MKHLEIWKKPTPGIYGLVANKSTELMVGTPSEIIAQLQHVFNQLYRAERDDAGTWFELDDFEFTVWKYADTVGVSVGVNESNQVYQEVWTK